MSPQGERAPYNVPGGAHIIVLGNEKGGSGKSTTAMHVIAGLLYEQRRVGCLDLDVRQGTLSRYLANRAEFCRRGGVRLPLPDQMTIEDGDPAALDPAVRALAARTDVIVIDCPGSDTPLSRRAHAMAAKLRRRKAERSRRIADEADSRVALREQIVDGHLATEDIVDHDARQRPMGDGDQDNRQSLALHAGDLLVGRAQRHDQQPVDAVARGEGLESVGALLERLDVEQQEVIFAPVAQPLDDAPQPFDDRASREERRHHPDHLRAAQRQPSRGRARPVAERVDRLAHANPGLVGDQRTVVEDTRHRANADLGVARDVADGRGRIPSPRWNRIHCAAA